MLSVWTEALPVRVTLLWIVVAVVTRSAVPAASVTAPEPRLTSAAIDSVPPLTVVAQALPLLVVAVSLTVPAPVLVSEVVPVMAPDSVSSSDPPVRP